MTSRRETGSSSAGKPAKPPARRGRKPVSARSHPHALNGDRARDREVIDHAVQIFWEKGYASASVQDVAESLGMLKGSLYYYIDSKESLLRKIFDDSHEEISEIIESAVHSEGRAVERLSRLLADYAMWTLTHLERSGLYAREWRYASGDLKRALVENQRYYDRELRSLIGTAQAEGDLDRAVDVRRSSLLIWSALTGLADWFRPGRLKAQDVAADFVSLALRAAGG